MATINALPASIHLPHGKKYHCNFIYNYAARRHLVTDDTKLSLKFVEFLVGELKSWGYSECYYYDEHSRPGADVFDQIFEAAESSMWTFVILTEYFSQNLWVKYSARAVMKTMISENHDSRDKLIPIVLGSAPVPKELDVNDVLSFALDETSWRNKEHKQQLKKLRRELDGVARAETQLPIPDPGDGILRSDVGHMIVNPVPSMQGDSNITQNINESQMESLSSSVAAMHVLSTLPLPPESLATSSPASQDRETSSSSSRTDKEAKSHRNVLNRCLPALLRDLDFGTVSIYIQQNELLNDVIIRDILEQKTTSEKIRELIQQIKKRDKDVYGKFKECLVQAGQAYLRDKLEEEEIKEDKQCTENGVNTVKTTEGYLSTQPLSSDGSDTDLDDVDGPSSQCIETDGLRQKNSEGPENQPGRLTQLIPQSICQFDAQSSSTSEEQSIPTEQLPEELIPNQQSVSLSEILSKLESSVITGHVNIVNVHRENVLDGGFRAFGCKTFDMRYKLDVKFAGEDGLDAGGPGRDFMRLAVMAIKELPIFSGPDNKKMLALDRKCFDERTYYKAGQMLAYFIVHRGPCPNFISPTLYSALAEGIASVQPTSDEIFDHEVRQQVEAIAAASNEKDFYAAVEKAYNLISMAGCSSFASQFTPEKQTKLVKYLTKFVVCDRIKEPFKQFKKGLQTMGLVDEIKKNKTQWKEVFIFSTKPLCASQVDNMFDVKWSPEGSNKHRKEKKILTFWRDFLHGLEEGQGEIPLTLKNLLAFTTGADEVPPLGFPIRLQLYFRHPEDFHDEKERYTAGFPYANTCSMVLKIPVVDDYETFQRNMTAALSETATFTDK